MELKEIGPWAYIIGVVIALLAGFAMPGNAMVALALGVLGLIVGLLNITDKEVQLFLVASIAFIVGASSLGGVLEGLFAAVPVVGIGAALVAALQYMVAFTAPAAAIVGLLALYKLSKD